MEQKAILTYPLNHNEPVCDGAIDVMVDEAAGRKVTVLTEIPPDPEFCGFLSNELVHMSDGDIQREVAKRYRAETVTHGTSLLMAIRDIGAAASSFEIVPIEKDYPERDIVKSVYFLFNLKLSELARGVPYDAACRITRELLALYALEQLIRERRETERNRAMENVIRESISAHGERTHMLFAGAHHVIAFQDSSQMSDIDFTFPQVALPTAGAVLEDDDSEEASSPVSHSMDYVSALYDVNKVASIAAGMVLFGIDTEPLVDMIGRAHHLYFDDGSPMTLLLRGLSENTLSGLLGKLQPVVSGMDAFEARDVLNLAKGMLCKIFVIKTHGSRQDIENLLDFTWGNTDEVIKGLAGTLGVYLPELAKELNAVRRGLTDSLENLLPRATVYFFNRLQEEKNNATALGKTLGGPALAPHAGKSKSA